MKKSMKYVAALLGMTILAGCDAYLEENPDNRVELNTPEKAAQLLTNAYSSAGYNFTEWMSDNVTYTTGVTRLLEHNQFYLWEDVTGINQDTPTNFWNSTYDAIAHSNEVLDVIDKMEGERSFKNAVKAEAYLTRAYGHFMLVNLFAKQYNDETSRNDPGIPYVEEPEREFIKTYTRASMRDVYNKIEDDILDGLRYVNDSYYANSGKYHFNRNAALALASRFYLYKGEYDNCIEYSSEMLGEDPAIFVKDIASLLESTANPLDFLRVTNSPGEMANLLLIRQVTNAHVNVGFWPSPNQVQSLYNSNPFDADDVRTSLRYPIFLRGSGWALGKFDFLFERLSLTSNVGFNYTIFPAFRGEEVLLNRAESYAAKNQVSQAIADLQHFVRYRYDGNPTITINALKTHYGTGNNQEALRRFILDERKKEFMHEGLRWFDIKRFDIPVAHAIPNSAPAVLNAEDNRKVLQIPQAAIDVGGLQPNPR